MSVVREVAERYWTGTFNELAEPFRHPVYSALITTDADVVTEGLAFVLNFANVCVIEADDGLIIVDSGSSGNGADLLKSIEKFSSKPIHTCIFTHGHVDHVGGIKVIEAEYKNRGLPPIKVISHESVVKRFDRYLMTRGYNSAINTRQFQTKSAWPRSYRYPNVTYVKEMKLEVGSKKKQVLHLFHNKGETDDATWVWIPEKKAICTGDFFIWATPNCGNPQKVQRYPIEWAQTMRKMSELGAEYLLPGHGPPIYGKERVHQALTDTAMFLESICKQTIDAINEGLSLNEVVQKVKFDQELLKKPYLRPVYDDPRFIIHNIWRLLCGWWDLNPAHLRIVSDQELSKEISTLAGGESKLVERSLELLKQGNLDLAVQIIQTALHSNPTDRRINEVALEIFSKKEKQETSLMAQSVFRSAKFACQRVLEGKPKL